jgi:hypothetical protein
MDIAIIGGGGGWLGTALIRALCGGIGQVVRLTELCDWVNRWSFTHQHEVMYGLCNYESGVYGAGCIAPPNHFQQPEPALAHSKGLCKLVTIFATGLKIK